MEGSTWRLYTPLDVRLRHLICIRSLLNLDLGATSYEETCGSGKTTHTSSVHRLFNYRVHKQITASNASHRTISMDTAGEDFASDKTPAWNCFGRGGSLDYSNLPNSPTSTLYPPSPTAHGFKFRKEYASGVTLATMVDLSNGDYSEYKPTSPKGSVFPPAIEGPHP